MALTTTTLSAALTTSSTKIVVASATGFAVNSVIRIDYEQLRVSKDWDGTSTTIPVLRGLDGTATAAHASSANVTVGLASDFGVPGADVQDASILPGVVPYTVTSYSASGAIAVPTAVGISVAILNGTGTLAMTLAQPTKDVDGALLMVVGNGKSQSTVTLPSASGVGNAGSSYDVLTLQNAGQVCLTFVACNGVWCLQAGVLTGTTTALSAAIA